MSSTPCARPASACVAVHTLITLPRSMTPLGRTFGLFAWFTSLNHPSFLSLSTNQRLRHMDRCSPFFVSQPQYSGASCHAI